MVRLLIYRFIAIILANTRTKENFRSLGHPWAKVGTDSISNPFSRSGIGKNVLQIRDDGRKPARRVKEDDMAVFYDRGTATSEIPRLSSVTKR